MKAVDIARQWLAARWNAERREPRSGTITDWLDLVLDAGWAAPSWSPDWWGRQLSTGDSRDIRKAFKAVRAPGAGQDLSNIVAAMVMRFGSDDLKREVLPGLLTGRHRQCLLYSEPNAGSDLASLQTRGETCDEGYRIHGQKIWTSGADVADLGLLIARTTPRSQRRDGLTMLLLPMRQAGVDVRPIRQITGESLFNEVFLDGPLVPTHYRLGEEGQGWTILRAALAIERQIMGDGVGEGARTKRPHQSTSLINLLKSTGKLSEPALRLETATVLAKRHLTELTQKRAQSDAAAAKVSRLPSLAKLAMSDVLHSEARLLRRFLGAESLLDGPAFPVAAEANYRAANAYMTSIGGGTDQIQRNIIAQQILGLPRGDGS